MVNKKAEMLRKLADSFETSIQNKLNTHSGANITHKRAKEQASARIDAYNMQDSQKLLREAANLAESGLPDFLKGFRYKKSALNLVSAINRFKSGLPFNNYYQLQAGKAYADIQVWEQLVDWGTSVLSHDDGREQEAELAELEAKVRLARIPGFFPTPKTVITEFMLPKLTPAQLTGKVLEPSAGNGNIAELLNEPDVIECNYSLRNILGLKGFNLVAHDFLEYQVGGYSAIVGNPPFEKGQDIQHIMHAYSLLAEDGGLVFIMSEGPFFRNDKQSVMFREWLESVNGYSEWLPKNSFKLSGTGVSARVVWIHK